MAPSQWLLSGTGSPNAHQEGGFAIGYWASQWLLSGTGSPNSRPIRGFRVSSSMNDLDGSTLTSGFLSVKEKSQKKFEDVERNSLDFATFTPIENVKPLI
jgi:hypothetical protein